MLNTHYNLIDTLKHGRTMLWSTCVRLLRHYVENNDALYRQHHVNQFAKLLVANNAIAELPVATTYAEALLWGYFNDYGMR